MKLPESPAEVLGGESLPSWPHGERLERCDLRLVRSAR
jgi:hypothetical protein